MLGQPGSTPLDDARPDGASYVLETVACLWDNLPGVLFGGIVFGVAALPGLVCFAAGATRAALLAGALLTGPALLALLALLAAYVQGRYTPVRFIFTALKRFVGRGARLGLLVTFPLWAAMLTWPALAQPDPAPVVWLGLAADALGLLVMLTLVIYAAPLIVLDDAPLIPALRAALVLASRHLVNTFGLLAMGVLCGLLIVYVSFALLFLLPAVWGLFAVNNCRMVVGQERSKG